MKYQYYTSSDFALDRNFQQWVLSPDEKSNKFWNDWLQAYPGKGKEVAEAIKMVHMAGLSADHQANAAFLEVWGELHANVRKEERSRRLSKVFRYSRMAAVWIAFILLATYVLWDKGRPAVPVVYTTGYGEIKKIVLADGSKITLNANSSIRLSDKNWENEALREVFLKGEAFFEIARTSDHKKFIVTTADSVAVQVLGTEFNVNTRREKTAVYLQSGKVQISATAQQVMLKPGDFAEYNQQEKRVHLGQAREEDKLAWKNNFFVFDDASLLDIARELEDNYGTKVIISDESLAQKKFTAKVPRNKVNVLLKVLAETLQIDIIRQNNEVRIQPKSLPVK
jgi:ferric-dicitrate binding protein FerR (iron transport regulator)